MKKNNDSFTYGCRGKYSITKISEPNGIVESNGTHGSTQSTPMIIYFIVT